MGLMKQFFSQTRKPEGFLGKIMLGTMNSGHAKMADWGMTHLSGTKTAQVIELGCGAGRNAGELLKRFPEAHVTAIDYSELSAESAAAYNQSAVQAGRCTVLQGDVSALAFPEGSFDLATAFETIYFWPGLEKCFAEVARVLKPDGTFLICNESDGEDQTAKKFEKIIDGMKCYTPEEIEAALKIAGFREVKSNHHPSKPWITVLAKK
ncbi:MAG: class I SAM-dependent methyltransferase [Lachnospiraceae bacterium]|nr:class I SAM-dependent methyltransferase [Lachnospiraceae bacterium]